MNYTAPSSASSEPISHNDSALSSRIERYWSRRAGSYGTTRRVELSSDKKNQWLAEILPHLQGKQPLRVLDIGTGTGFFAILLAQQGHTACGIDMSEAMLEEGRLIAKQHGCAVDFQKMDASCLNFEGESMDVVISRNLTWTLQDAAEAYKEWYRVLRSGGILLNFDANYGSVSFMDVVRHPGTHAHVGMDDGMMEECECIRRELPLSRESRPDWDMRVLRDIGFSQCQCDMKLSSRIYTEQDATYNPVPMFAIRAMK
ncbi:class I SAM-dependent methyltransferase [Desulfovibrio intestinalis]|uniref:SAM-dependent methyltransferase n=1 Tax=Desulfovibrio intestinalis TaxID=58621 RepID=A0A7W8C136_9BACT|nr:class I SAM-dependent methyltransferase [Desulfovibrio intestinalis]MBB5143692.1 SAM-dependent methyltransferase [Desulfovibrio intestinalis]